MENLDLLVNELRKYESETQWFEFKHNNYDPDMIGKDISALANGAALTEKTNAYMVWGVDDKTHDVVGTSINQYNLKVGKQEIESWLRTMLSKNAEFEFQNIQMKDSNGEYKDIVVLIIYKASNQTVMFKKDDYIRVGSYTKLLNDEPAIKGMLWDKLRMEKFETAIAKKDLTPEATLEYIDFAKYFELKKETIPSSLNNILHFMIEEGIVLRQDNGLYSITNLGAILFARNISNFPRVARKAIRVVKYQGNDRLEIQKEFVGGKGYALGFNGLMDVISALLPSKEVFEGALRKTVKFIPS